MTDSAYGVCPDKRDRLAAIYGLPDVFALGVSPASIAAAAAAERNDRLDVSDTYPVDAPDVFVRGGYGLYSTLGDYLRFAQMLANGGELNGGRLLGCRTVELMYSNHLPAALLPFGDGGGTYPGWGFGLGSRVMLDVTATGGPGSIGEHGWSGAGKHLLLGGPP